MCKPEKCNNCQNCPARKNWKIEQEKSDLKIELDQRVTDVKEYISEEDIDEEKLDILLTDLSDTFKMCVKKNVIFSVEEI